MGMVMKVAASKYCSIEVRITSTVALFRDSVTSFQTRDDGVLDQQLFYAVGSRPADTPRSLRFRRCVSDLGGISQCACSISDFHHEYMI